MSGVPPNHFFQYFNSGVTQQGPAFPTPQPPPRNEVDVLAQNMGYLYPDLPELVGDDDDSPKASGSQQAPAAAAPPAPAAPAAPGVVGPSAFDPTPYQQYLLQRQLQHQKTQQQAAGQQQPMPGQLQWGQPQQAGQWGVPPQPPRQPPSGFGQ